MRIGVFKSSLKSLGAEDRNPPHATNLQRPAQGAVCCPPDIDGGILRRCVDEALATPLDARDTLQRINNGRSPTHFD